MPSISKIRAVGAHAAMPPLPAGAVHRYATVNGATIHYVEAGRSDAEPLVLLHGFPQHWYMWRDLIPELAKHFRVIVPDLPGSGWSDAPADGDYSKAALADDVARFMDAVGASRARVMGHDMGGFIGFQLALRHPEHVRQFVALNIFTPWPSERQLAEVWRFAYQPVLAAPLLGVALLRQPWMIRAMLRTAAHRNPWTDDELAAFADVWRNEASAEAGSAMYRTFLARELLPWASGGFAGRTLQPPTLLLTGEHDPVIRASLIGGFEPHAREMRQETVPDAGHFLPEERPDEVLARVLAFFGVTDAPAQRIG